MSLLPLMPLFPVCFLPCLKGDDKQAAAGSMPGMQAMPGMQGMQMPFFAPPGFFPSPMMPVRGALGALCTLLGGPGDAAGTVCECLQGGCEVGRPVRCPAPVGAFACARSGPLAPTPLSALRPLP